jgi:subtilase family serine protease
MVSTMNATSRQTGCTRAVLLVFALAAPACAMDEAREPLTQMTAQEIATAGNVATCSESEVYEVHCHGRVIANSSGCPHQNPAPAGFSPSQLRSAYKISSSGSSATTIAVIEAYGYANAEADLAKYRSQFSLPTCTTANGCFKKVNQDGGAGNYPEDELGWMVETALDLDMVSAICRNCKILLVQATTSSFADIAVAVQLAADLGAHVISNSYGGDEFFGIDYEYAYDYPEIAVVASTGDVGYGIGVEFPSSSAKVTAVGGTSLSTSSTSRGFSETAWSGSVSGCSLLSSKPSWQHDTGCDMRTVADVSAVADPNTGVAVYGPVDATTSGWIVLGGTSVSAPIISGVYGVNGGAVHGSSDPYAHLSGLFDIKTGNTGFCEEPYLCNAGTGYDGPTGLGTPNGTSAF